jgi:hypothetical protein
VIAGEKRDRLAGLGPVPVPNADGLIAHEGHATGG